MCFALLLTSCVLLAGESARSNSTSDVTPSTVPPGIKVHEVQGDEGSR